MKSLLSAHFSMLSGAIRKNLTRVRKHSDRKSVHALRVSLKKIRALMQVLNHIEPKVRLKKEHRSLRKLFKEAGEVRNSHVRAGIIKEFRLSDHGLTGIANKLNQKTQRHSSRLKKKLAKFDEKKILDKIGKGVKKVSAARPDKSITAFVSGFAKMNMKKALRLSGKSSLHRARVKLKTAHYALDILAEETNAAAAIATIDPIEQRLGRWQDCSITSQLLMQRLRKSKTGNPMKHQLNSEIANEISRIETLARKDFLRLKKMLPGFISR